MSLEKERFIGRRMELFPAKRNGFVVHGAGHEGAHLDIATREQARRPQTDREPSLARSAFERVGRVLEV